MAAVVGVVLAGFIALTAAFAGHEGAPIGIRPMGHTASSPLPLCTRRKSARPSACRTHGWRPVASSRQLPTSTTPDRGPERALILDRNLQPVWFQPVPGSSSRPTSTCRATTANWCWRGGGGAVTNTGATESGEWVVVNQHYQPILRLKAKDGWVLTLHELIIDGDVAWVTANKNIPKNLSKWGGAYNGAVIDSAVQEYDLRTGRLLRNWDALDHVPLSQSEATIPTNGFPWDAYHVNSSLAYGRRALRRVDARHVGGLHGRHRHGPSPGRSVGASRVSSSGEGRVRARRAAQPNGVVASMTTIAAS
jgi:hypothetical protein